MTNEEVLNEMNSYVQSLVYILLKNRSLPEADDHGGGLMFTGWKPRHDFFTGGNTTFWEEGLVGQWLDWRDITSPKYINLPNYIGGEYHVGDSFNIEGAKVALGQRVGIEEMLAAGLDKLLALSEALT